MASADGIVQYTTAPANPSPYLVAEFLIWAPIDARMTTFPGPLVERLLLIDTH